MDSKLFSGMGKALGVFVLLGLLVGCATSPTGRSQLLLMSEPQMAEMGAAAFVQMQGKVPRSTDAAKTQYVRCVTGAIVQVLTPEDMNGASVSSWEVELFDDKSANAFALPGGKIGVHTGLLDVAKTPDQLAAVLGHEVGHVLAKHSNARVSNSQLANTGLGLASVFLGGDTAASQQAMALLGMGVDMAVIKPFGRADESEADEIGLMLMARAGFDPTHAVDLWQNMAASGGPSPPEFMSTHPSHATRITQLNGWMTEAMPLYRQAQAAGRRPNCR